MSDFRGGPFSGLGPGPVSRCLAPGCQGSGMAPGLFQSEPSVVGWGLRVRESSGAFHLIQEELRARNVGTIGKEMEELGDV